MASVQIHFPVPILLQSHAGKYNSRRVVCYREGAICSLAILDLLRHSPVVVVKTQFSLFVKSQISQGYAARWKF